MKIIDEQIQWYEQNATRKDDDLIKANLKLINNLFDEIENSEDRIFIDKIISTFCEIMEIQRDVIQEAEYNDMIASGYGPTQSNLIATYVPQMEGFKNDEQLRSAFAYYLTHQVKKPFSSYTINDYCSRIKILWKSFYEECKNNEMPDSIRVLEERVVPDNPLLNAYHHIDEIQYYLNMKISLDKENRNLTNARAAFNKLDKFKKRRN